MREQIDELISIGIAGAMIGRNAIIDPTIFAKLKGSAPIPPIEQIRKEYLSLSKKYGAKGRYRNNVLRHLGVDSSLDGFIQ